MLSVRRERDAEEKKGNDLGVAAAITPPNFTRARCRSRSSAFEGDKSLINHARCTLPAKLHTHILPRDLLLVQGLFSPSTGRGSLIVVLSIEQASLTLTAPYSPEFEQNSTSV